MKKIVFAAALIFISSCGEQMVLVEKECKKWKQMTNCSIGCQNTGLKLSKFKFTEDTVMFIETDIDDGDKTIQKLTNCKIIDNRNWECRGDLYSQHMFDGIYAVYGIGFSYGKYCAK